MFMPFRLVLPTESKQIEGHIGHRVNYIRELPRPEKQNVLRADVRVE